jgi:hypothetical protein
MCLPPTPLNPPDPMDIDGSPPTNPFTTEKRFENDLEYRILSSEPDGSSTPRQRHPATRTFNGQEPGHGHDVDSNTRSDNNMAAIEHMESHECSRVMVEDENTVAPGILLNSQNSRTPKNRSDANATAKKHPYPVKKYLEKLETALDKYKDLGRTGANEDAPDELAGAFPPVQPLTPRDKNGRIVTRASPRCRENATSKPRRPPQWSLSRRAAFRIPRTIGTRLDHRGGQRLVPRFLPVDTKADEVDELV